MLKHRNGLPVILTALCILTYFNQICFGHHILVIFVENMQTDRQTTTCGNTTFRCNNGNYIAFHQVCDGIVDCSDRSDEISATCQARGAFCAEFSYKCAYGACVDGDARCNGVQDCADNSDEIGCPDPDNHSDVCGVKFSCKNDQCIDRYLQCDGVKNCINGTDETFDSCNGNACHEYSYRCAYGACVDGDAECNGVIDCADGSDESEEICGSRNVTTEPAITTNTTTVDAIPSDSSCSLPPQPANGGYTYTVTEQSGFTIIQDTCNANHTPYPPNYVDSICQDGQWYPESPQCLSQVLQNIVSPLLIITTSNDHINRSDLEGAGVIFDADIGNSKDVAADKQVDNIKFDHMEVQNITENDKNFKLQPSASSPKIIDGKCSKWNIQKLKKKKPQVLYTNKKENSTIKFNNLADVTCELPMLQIEVLNSDNKTKLIISERELGRLKEDMEFKKKENDLRIQILKKELEEKEKNIIRSNEEHGLKMKLLAQEIKLKEVELLKRHNI